MIGPTDLLHPSPAPHFKTSQAFLICCPERPSFSSIQPCFKRSISLGLCLYNTITEFTSWGYLYFMIFCDVLRRALWYNYTTQAKEMHNFLNEYLILNFCSVFENELCSNAPTRLFTSMHLKHNITAYTAVSLRMNPRSSKNVGDNLSRGHSFVFKVKY